MNKFLFLILFYIFYSTSIIAAPVADLRSSYTKEWQNLVTENMACNIRYNQTNDILYYNKCYSNTFEKYDSLIKRIRSSSKYSSTDLWKAKNFLIIESNKQCKNLLIQTNINHIIQTELNGCDLIKFNLLVDYSLELMK